MRDNPWYLWVPGTVLEVAIGTGLVMIYGVPWYFVAPIMVLRKFYNFLSGHVFWGKQNPKVEEEAPMTTEDEFKVKAHTEILQEDYANKATGPMKCLSCGSTAIEHEIQDHLFVLSGQTKGYVWLCSDHPKDKHGLGCRQVPKVEEDRSEH